MNPSEPPGPDDDHRLSKNDTRPDKLTPVSQRLLHLLLGKERIQALRVVRALLVAAAYAVSMLVIWMNAAFGYCTTLVAGWMSAYMAFGPVFFFVLLRSGWNLRLQDPAMTMPQMLYGLGGLMLAYPINAASHGLNILVAGLLPLFGFQVLSRRQAYQMAVLSPLGFGMTIAVMAWRYPGYYDPRAELVNFLTAAVCLPAMALLMRQLSAIQFRVSAQRADLKEALRRIQAISTLDELTGLVNRRHMTQLLDNEVNRRSRCSTSFCVALLDIDHFKRINDMHGHACGDEVLRRFAQIAGKSLREADVLARWGGEEFLLLMPATFLHDGVEVLQRLSEKMADSTHCSFCPELQVTFSAGLVEDGGAALNDIIELADKALYRAKAQGRNQVAVADASDSVAPVPASSC